MRRVTAWGLGLLTWLIVIVTATTAGSQSFQGGLRGAVKDANGVIPGVEVSLINEGTAIARSTLSNESGEYAFAAVTPGTYTVKAVLQGFKTFERKGLTVGTQQFITLDLVMEVGTIQEEISVTAAAPLIETLNASTGEVLDKKSLDTLPAAGRNAFMMAVTVPTVIATGDAQFNRMQDQSNASLVSLGGGARRANNYLIDGVPITDMSNRPVLFPTIEAVDEVKVQVHTYDAEMGRTGGGVFNTTGKSGTNELHGSGFWQSRPTWGQSNNFFNERANIPLPSGLYFHTYGGGIGGPIIKNRTFFWSAYEGYRSNTTRNGQLIFPTDLERKGDFSQTFDNQGRLVVIYDPLTTRTVNGATVRDPFPGNVIPADRINPVAKNVVSFFPAADKQVSGGNGAPNYLRTAQIHDEADMVTTKVEHKMSDKWSLTGMYVYSRTNEPTSTYFGDTNPFADPGGGILKRRPQIVAVNSILIPNPSTVVSLRYGYTTFPDRTEAVSRGYSLTSLGFPASLASAVTAEKFPAFAIDGQGEIGGTTSIGDRAIGGSIWGSWGVNGSLSKFIGRHTLKAGADFRHMEVKGQDLGQSSGTYQFDREWTALNPTAATAINSGYGLASFLLGLTTANSSRTSSVPIVAPLTFFTDYTAGYVQDDFRLNSKLTLNFGLRFEHETGIQEIDNRTTVAFDTNAVSPLVPSSPLPDGRTQVKGGLRYAGKDGFPTYQTDPRSMKFSPRGGAAWSLDDKTVIRGGYGLFWAPWNYTSSATTNYGQLGFSESTFTDQSDRLNPTVTLSNPFPGGLRQPAGSANGLLTGVGTNVVFIPQDRKSPYVQQFSIDVQREIPGSMAVSIGYNGARGDDLAYGGTGVALVNINALTKEQLAQYGSTLNDQLPNPFFGNPAAGSFATRATLSRGQLLRPFPQFLNVQGRDPGGATTRYHAVIAKLSKRVTHGWGGNFHYTWSRLQDNQFAETNFYSTQNQGARPLDPYNLDAEYGTGLLNEPHRFVLTPIIELPFGEGKKWLTGGLGDRIFGGWQVSMIATYESGFPINIVQNVDPGNFNGFNRPNYTGTDPVTDGALFTSDSLGRLNGYMNSAAYANAAPFTLGTAPRLDDRNLTPFRTNYDVVFAKDTRVFGGTKAQIRIEMLNLTNDPKFREPDAVLGSSTFGKITRQGGFARLTQITLRMLW